MTVLNSRNPYFDFLRGMAIIMVIGIHTVKKDNLGFQSVEDICTVLLRLVLNCAVPLFLAISGFFLGKRDISFGERHIRFLKRQIPKVYVPCLIFSLPYLFMAIYSDTHNVFKSLATYFACGFSVYYFIALIIQYYLLLPILSKCDRWVGVITSAIISITCILIVTYILHISMINLPLLIYAGPFPLWLVFFVMGIYFSKSPRDYSIIPPIIMIIIGFVMQIGEYLFWLNKGQIVLGIKLSSFIFSSGLIWFLFSKKIENSYSENIIFSTINWIGGISFGIYLLHCYIIMAARKLLPELQWLVLWSLVLSISVLIIWAIKSIFPKFSDKYLGFR